MLQSLHFWLQSLGCKFCCPLLFCAAGYGDRLSPGGVHNIHFQWGLSGTRRRQGHEAGGRRSSQRRPLRRHRNARLAKPHQCVGRGLHQRGDERGQPLLSGADRGRTQGRRYSRRETRRRVSLKNKKKMFSLNRWWAMLLIRWTRSWTPSITRPFTLSWTRSVRDTGKRLGTLCCSDWKRWSKTDSKKDKEHLGHAWILNNNAQVLTLACYLMLSSLVSTTIKASQALLT